MRVIGSTLQVSNFWGDYTPNVRKFQAVFQKTPTVIRVKVTSRSQGTPYADKV